MNSCRGILLVLLLWTVTALAWDSEELEIFDLVEEINKNFYEFMGIHQEATNQEIKRAFRNLSIVLHPDKNAAEDANIQFRNLVSIYEVLKDTSKREKYNKVLKDGLPNWKSALYYYRRMRKIGLYEGSFILFIIITIGQYLFAWAAYFEKKFTAEQIFGSKLKKLQKKNKTINMDSILSEIPTPSVLNTLPFQIPLAIWNIPGAIKSAAKKAYDLKEIALEKRRQEAEQLRQQEEAEKQLEEQARLRKEKKDNLRRRKQNTKVPEKTDAELEGYAKIEACDPTKNNNIQPATQKQTVLSGGFWTDEDLGELIRLVKKYPSGSINRWKTIAEAMNRTIQEVTFMAAKMKDNGYRIQNQGDTGAGYTMPDTTVVSKKVKSKKQPEKDLVTSEANWSQEQQRALESALMKYKKTAVEDRWQKIANSVPGKTKLECQMRYKYLCKAIKTQNGTSFDMTGDAPEKNDKGLNKVHDDVILKNLENNVATSSILEEQAPNISELSLTKNSGKRSKRQERRKRKDFSSGDDSDDAYLYEIS